MDKILLIVFFVMLGMIAVTPCDCQETGAVKVADGDIAAVDTFNSTITVRTLKYYPNLAYEEMIFSVPAGMQFVKREETIDIFDLNVGDHVTIRYYEGPASAKIISMVVY